MCNNWFWIILVIWFLSGQNGGCGAQTIENGCGCYNVNTTVRRGNGCGCTETVTTNNGCGCGCTETVANTNNGCYKPCY